VVIGARSGGKAEVVEGAKAGDRIVVDGTGKLRPGAKVVEAAASAAPSATAAATADPTAAKPQAPAAAPGG
jgi:membrane fusion protein (multidrug efflux system)